MYRAGATFPGQKVIQAGVLDDMSVLNGLKIDVELFAPDRLSWLSKLHFTEDKQNMN